MKEVVNHSLQLKFKGGISASEVADFMARIPESSRIRIHSGMDERFITASWETEQVTDLTHQYPDGTL